MPYVDTEIRRTYDREYKRLHRAGQCLTLSQTLLPAQLRIQRANDILDLLSEQIGLVRNEQQADTLEKARTVGFLAGIALKAVEAADLSARVEAMEQALNSTSAILWRQILRKRPKNRIFRLFHDATCVNRVFQNSLDRAKTPEKPASQVPEKRQKSS